MAGKLGSLIDLIGLRRKTGNPAGTASPPTYNPAAPNFRLAMPWYRDHLIDVADARQIADSKLLMELMATSDPDVSAAINAYLTVADTHPIIYIRDANGQFEPRAYQTWNQLLLRLGYSTDLTTGYQAKPSLRVLCEQMRYLCLLRGAVGAELVTDKDFLPNEVRLVDAGTLRWYERFPGKMSPEQWPRGSQTPIDLDIPTFFYCGYRNSPLSAYPTPPFVSAINTIVARQNIINDLYRIMQLTGFPRIDVKVMEDVLRNSAPANFKNDPTALRGWIEARIQEIRNAFATMQPDEAFVHTDATEIKMVNEKAAASMINIDSVIKVLNAQNQAGLKSVSTILGRGESGVNTASVEARVFSMNADGLNLPVGEVLSKFFTCAFQLFGFPYFVEVRFRPAELRPLTELEPQFVMRQARLLEALSLGLITDDEFHMEMYGRLPHDGAPMLSGTNFLLVQASTGNVDQLSPNNDPLGRSISPEGSSGARSNQTGGPGSAQAKKKQPTKVAKARLIYEFE